ncbi:hypothetical protein QTP88_024336 [Uroleucon formosanum]
MSKYSKNVRRCTIIGMRYVNFKDVAHYARKVAWFTNTGHDRSNFMQEAFSVFATICRISIWLFGHI